MKQAAGTIWIKFVIGLLVVALTAACVGFAFLEILCWEVSGYNEDTTPDETVETWLGWMMQADMDRVMSEYWPAVRAVETNADPNREELYGRTLERWQQEFDPEAKSFRFTLRNADGEVKLTNVPEDTEERYLLWDVKTYDEDGERYTLYGYVTTRTDIDDMYTHSRIAIVRLTQYQERYVPFAVVSGLLALIGLCWLLYAAGRRSDGTVQLRAVDRIPWDLFLGVNVALFCGVVLLIFGLFHMPVLGREFTMRYGEYYLLDLTRTGDMVLWMVSIAGGCTALALMVLMSWAARVKVKGWLKNSVIYRVCAWIGRGCKKAGSAMADKVLPKEVPDGEEKRPNVLVRGWRKFWGGIARFFRFLGRSVRSLLGKSGETVQSLPLVWKGIVLAAALFLLELLALLQALMWDNGFWVILLNAAVAVVIVRVCVVMRQLQTAAKNIADGDLNYRVDTSKMRLDFKAHGEDLNRIGDGLLLAVDDRLKSERMKTELITNVSHDLKTPLTSIVNYVDLLKKEQLTGTVGEYVEVLDRQSARLKKLTEDLVEASKASTGNLHVTLETVNVTEFLEQAQAEYSARLVTAGLTVVMQVPDDALPARSDGRYLWRIMDNLLGNACKYALPGTRVYISARQDGDMVVIDVKNISRDKLNISADELMERFVRGDSSRNTEGSGLGLSIAQSLAALMGGKLELTVDGDLFKAEVFLPMAGV